MSVPAYSHIVVVVEENHNYDEIIGNTAQAPFINSLAAGGAVLSNFDALTHPSQPNYYALYAGSTDHPRAIPPASHPAGRFHHSGVVWDENDDESGALPAEASNQVPAILYGANVVPGTYNASYNDYNLLSTMLGAFSPAPRLRRSVHRP